MRKSAITALVIIIASLCSALESAGEERVNDRKSGIVIFKFKDTGKTEDYSYYSYIIPDSIAVELKNRTEYDARIHSVTIAYIKADEKAEKRQEHILYLSRKGSELSAEYTISGSFEVKDNKIQIKSQLFHVPTQKLVDIEDESDEIGVLIFSLIDAVTLKINNELSKIAKSKTEKNAQELTEPVAAISPFLPAYRIMEGATLYVEHGNMYLGGRWSEIYDDTTHYAAGIRYGFDNINRFKHSSLLSRSAVSLSYHHFIALPLPENMSSSLTVSGGVIGFAYEHHILENFFFSGEIATGGMFSTLRVYTNIQSGGPQPPADERNTIDPFFRLALMAGIELNPLVFFTGVSANRIFYSDEPLDFLSLIFSLGFRL